MTTDVHPAPVADSLNQLLARHSATIVAVAVLFFSAVMLLEVVASRRHSQKAVEARLINESQRHADALATYLTMRRNDIADVAERQEIASYLSSKAQGQAARKVLNANLGAIEDYLARKQRQAAGPALPGYRQLAFHDAAGQPLTGQQHAYPPHVFARMDRRQSQVHVEPAHNRILLSAPVLHDGRFEGMIVAATDLQPLAEWALNLRHGLVGHRPGDQHGFLVNQAGQTISARADTYRPDLAAGMAYAALAAGRLVPLNRALDPQNLASDLFVVRSPVPATDLSLITLVGRDELDVGGSSGVFLWTLGGLPLLLVAATLALEYQRRRRVLLQSDNSRLSREMVSREALERQLLEKNERLEQLAQELRRSAVQAEDASRAKSEFLAVMSHEIRTPMNGILGMAQVLATPGLDDNRRSAFAQVLISSGQTLLTLLDDILDLSKVEARKLSLHLVECNLSTLVQETSSLFLEQAQAKGLTLGSMSELRADERHMADPDRIRQMLANLVGNAIKFTDAGSVRVELRTVGEVGEEALVEFRVVDSGPGIAGDKLSGLFDHFSQLDSSHVRQHGGTGLGLAIVRKLAQLMGGSAQASSQPGKGSAFWFRVPLRRIPDVVAPAPSPAAPALVPRHARILVVDDIAMNAMVMQFLLTKVGMASVTASSGQKALELLLSGEGFDLVLMDIVMPDLDGLEVARRIRDWQTRTGQPRTPIIACSASAFSVNRQACSAAGMDDFLPKPVTLAALREMLQRWLPAALDSRPEAPTTGPAAETPAGPAPDPAVARPLMEALRPLVVAHRFDAFGAYEALQAATLGTSAEQAVRAIGESLRRLDFPQVLQLLVKLDIEVAAIRPGPTPNRTENEKKIT